MAMVFIIFFFLHCDFRMSSWDYFIATAVIYTLCWLYSQCRTYFEHGFKHKAQLFAETEDTLKITIDTNMEWAPGQHIFLRFLTCGVHAFTAHPFTICSVSQTGKRNQLVFFVKRRGGVTGRLMSLALKNPDHQVPVLLDGPYGGIPKGRLVDFEKNLIIGGGAGAGLTLSMVEEFVQTSHLRPKDEMKVVVATRDPGMRFWYIQALENIAARHSKSETIPRISFQIHETFSQETAQNPGSEALKLEDGARVQSLVSKECSQLTTEMFGVHFFNGRPNLPAIIHQMADQEGTSLGMVVCGPSSMHHDVCEAASAEQSKIMAKKPGSARELWLHAENFS